MRHVVRVWMLWLVFAMVTAQAEDIYKVDAEYSQDTLRVSLSVPDKHILYADMIDIEASTSGTLVSLRPKSIPKGKMKKDVVGGTGAVREVFLHDVTFEYVVDPSDLDELEVTVQYQGCNDSICFLPQTRTLVVSGISGFEVVSPIAEKVLDISPTESQEGIDWIAETAGFRVAGSSAGYMKTEVFLRFLEQSNRADGSDVGGAGWLEGKIKHLSELGIWLRVLVILVGGILLNLTPCVLPMIPINLAIIGAGAQASSRGRGFLMGGVYGLGIALTYGALGLVVVFGLGQFGALNSSPWFNLSIGLLFVVLALAMFDIIQIDFTRLRKQSAGTTNGKHGLLAVLAMGCVSALLAGACVAPVVIAVLLHAGDVYAKGNVLGLLLPFLLGLGMALPWPLAGGSLSLLPKPGVWMNRVKQGFGVLILMFALYYGHQAWSGFTSRTTGKEAKLLQLAQTEGAREEGWLTSLPEALEQAREENKSVFIDFWATWCKNCLMMEKTTFRDPLVLEALGEYVRVKAQAEDSFDPETISMLEHFKVLGLPTYVILVPDNETR